MMSKVLEFVNNKTYVFITIISLLILTFLLYYIQLDLDVTRNNSNSICRVSKATLKDLKLRDVNVTYMSAIISPESDYQILSRVTTVFKQFKKYNKHIKYKIIDLTDNPEELSKYDYADIKGALLINYGEKTIILPSQIFAQKNVNELNIIIEKVLIDELIKLNDENNYNIYYTNTHGEGIEKDDYSTFKMIISSMGYNFIPLDLSSTTTNNINYVMIVAPNNDFTLNEISKLETLISNGTNLFISLKSDRNNVPGAYLNLKGLIKKYGIVVEDEIVVDQIQDTKLIGVYENLNDTEKYIEDLNSIVYMPFSRKMKIIDSDIFTPVSIMASGELTADKNQSNNSSFPLVIRLFNDKSKVIISATPELINNTNISDNKNFIVFITKWLEKFNSNLEILPFVYTEYITNPNDLKPSLIFGIIKIIIPCGVLFFAIEMKIKRESSIRRIKIRKRIMLKRKIKRK